MAGAVTDRARVAAVERAVRAEALALLDRNFTLGEVRAALARVCDALADGETPRERAAALRRSRNQEMLAERARRQSRKQEMLAYLSRLEGEGHGPAAVGMVAKKFSPRDPTEQDSVARSLRRWRKKTDNPTSVRLVNLPVDRKSAT
jgi:hypothetical protein